MHQRRGALPATATAAHAPIATLDFMHQLTYPLLCLLVGLTATFDMALLLCSL